MNVAWKIFKGLLIVSWNLIKMTLIVINAVMRASESTHRNSDPSPYTSCEAMDLYYKGEISYETYRKATKDFL